MRHSPAESSRLAIRSGIILALFAVTVGGLASCVPDGPTSVSQVRPPERRGAFADCGDAETRVSLECGIYISAGGVQLPVEVVVAVRIKLCEDMLWCQSLADWGFNEHGAGPTWEDGSGGGAPYTAQQAAMFWSRAAHDSLLRHGLRGTDCEPWFGRLSSVSLDQDLNLQNNADQKRHYLRNPGQSATLMRDSAELWIAQNLANAQRTFAGGNADSAQEYLGMAIHTLTDKFSPAHVDANGLPNEYDFEMLGEHTWFDFLGISNGIEGVTNLTTAALTAGRNAVVNACAIVRGGG